MTIEYKLNCWYTTAKNFTGLKHFLRKVQESLIARVVLKAGELRESLPRLSGCTRQGSCYKAGQHGYPSRAAYKLIEIQDKHVIRDGSKVLDLGVTRKLVTFKEVSSMHVL